MPDESIQKPLLAQSLTKETSEDHPQVSRAFRPGRKWPRALCMGMLALCHVTFFLPLRALAPLPPDVDPWWGMGLVLADGAAAWVLIRRGLRKITEKKPRNWSE